MTVNGRIRITSCRAITVKKTLSGTPRRRAEFIQAAQWQRRSVHNEKITKPAAEVITPVQVRLKSSAKAVIIR